MKKLSVTFWIVLCGMILYFGSLWQRPLYLAELAGNGAALAHLYGGGVPAPHEFFRFLPLALAGTSPFAFRIVPAFLALLSGLFLFLAGKRSAFGACAGLSALIFLLTPAVFISGTSALPVMYNGAPLLLAALALFRAVTAASRGEEALWGLAGALFLSSAVVNGGLPPLLPVFIVLVLFLLLRPVSTPPERLLVFLAFPAALAALPLAGKPLLPLVPGLGSIKIPAATIGIGALPWILFVPGAARGFAGKRRELLKDDFTLYSLILALLFLFCAGVTSPDAGLLIPFFGGAAGVLGAGLLMEYEEEGFRSFNAGLYVAAGFFLLLAAAVGGYGASAGFLRPEWRLFSSRDAWALAALVPAVSAVWCFAGAGEKIDKERKFLSLCAGVAFALFALHGLVPLKITQRCAPMGFLRQAVLPRFKSDTRLWSDESMRGAAMLMMRTADVKLFSGKDFPKNGPAGGTGVCFLTADRKAAEKMPFPKTTLRAGTFSAVFYNIDFPEMRVRKP